MAALRSDTNSVPSLLLLCVPRLGISLQASLLQIVGYRSLVAEVEKLRREPYDCENPKHEEMLMKVRSSLWIIFELLTCKNE